MDIPCANKTRRKGSGCQRDNWVGYGDKTPGDREYTAALWVSTIDRLFQNGSAVNWAVMMIEIEKRRRMPGCVMKSEEYGSTAERLNQIRDRNPGDGGIKHKQPAGKWDVVSRIHSLNRSPLKHPPSSRSGCYNLLLLKPPHPHPRPRPLPLLPPPAILLPLPLSAFSAMPHCSRFHKAEAKFNVITECMFFPKYMRSIYDPMFQQSHISVYTQLQSLAISVSQNMHSHTVNPSTRSSTAYFLSMLPVPVETIWLSDC
jgi:hypothetical protein